MGKKATLITYDDTDNDVEFLLDELQNGMNSYGIHAEIQTTVNKQLIKSLDEAIKLDKENELKLINEEIAELTAFCEKMTKELCLNPSSEVIIKATPNIIIYLIHHATTDRKVLTTISHITYWSDRYLRHRGVLSDFGLKELPNMIRVLNTITSICESDD